MERNPGDYEYLAAVAGMAETYGIPETHFSETSDGSKVVYWVVKGQLKYGPVRGHAGDTVMVAYSPFDVRHVRIADLIPVPRFFGGAGS